MKKLSMIVLIGFAFLLAAVPVLRGEETGPEALIARARAVVLSQHFSRDEITKALVDALDASLLILPKTDGTKESRARIEGVKTIMEKGEIFSDEARQDLATAYKTVSGGKAWKVPEEVTAAAQGPKGIEQATKVCGQLLDSALAAHKTGRNEESVRDLLGMVILVVTPMEAGR